MSLSNLSILQDCGIGGYRKGHDGREELEQYRNSYKWRPVPVEDGRK